MVRNVINRNNFSEVYATLLLLLKYQGRALSTSSVVPCADHMPISSLLHSIHEHFPGL